MIPPKPGNLPRRGIRSALLTGLSVLVGLLLAVGIYASLALNRLVLRELSGIQQYLRRAEPMSTADAKLDELSYSVRSYLLIDQDAKRLPFRERARNTWPEVVDAVRRYREVALDRRELTDLLDSQLARYWAAADAGLRLEGNRHRREALDLYLRTLVPMRDGVLETVSEIGSRDRTQALSDADVAEDLARLEGNRLWMAIGLACFLSLSVAGVTYKHVAKLEQTVEDQYNHAVRASTELELLSERLLNVQEDERRRIARDLHDDFGQRVASLIFELSGAAEGEGTTPELRRKLQSAGERLGNLAKDLQQVSRSLHSAVLEKVGLEAAIRSNCDALSGRGPLNVDFHAAGVPPKLPDSIALAMYRVFQESIQNALKHSRTSRVDVSLAAAEDFGCGFEAKPDDWSCNLGLVSMRERLRMVGGSLKIRSKTGKGTEVEARIPLS